MRVKRKISILYNKKNDVSSDKYFVSTIVALILSTKESRHRIGSKHNEIRGLVKMKLNSVSEITTSIL